MPPSHPDACEHTGEPSTYVNGHQGDERRNCLHLELFVTSVVGSRRVCETWQALPIASAGCASVLRPSFRDACSGAPDVNEGLTLIQV